MADLPSGFDPAYHLLVHGEVAEAGMDPAEHNLVPGFYGESLAPERRAGLPTTASLVYVDCDMYDSTVDVLGYLDGVLKHGTIVGFDDYFCWSPERSSGEQIALDEFKARRPDLTFNPYQPPVARHVFYVTTDRNER